MFKLNGGYHNIMGDFVKALNECFGDVGRGIDKIYDEFKIFEHKMEVQSIKNDTHFAYLMFHINQQTQFNQLQIQMTSLKNDINSLKILMFCQM